MGEFDDFAAPGGTLDDYLAERIEEQAEQERATFGSVQERDDHPLTPGDPGGFAPDEDRELTVYGAMRVAAEAAVDALRGRMLSAQANAFRSYLISFCNELRS